MVKCQRFLALKKRHCKFDVVKGSEYCSYHQAAADCVVCPLDPSHSIPPKRLMKHVTRCPKARDSALEAVLPFVSEGINRCFEEESYEAVEVDLSTWKPQVEAWWDEMKRENAKQLVPFILGDPDELLVLEEGDLAADAKRWEEYWPPESPLHPVCRDLADTLGVPDRIEGRVTERLRHELQNKRLLEAACQGGLLDHENLVVVELGAGKGALTRWFVQLNQLRGTMTKCLLLEREKRRNNKEGKDSVMMMDKEVSTVRLRTDITHFDMARFEKFLNSGDSTLMHPSDQCFTTPSVLLKLKKLGVEVPGLTPSLYLPYLRHIGSKSGTNPALLESTLESWTGPKPFILVLAKHLCGVGLDIGLECASRGDLNNRGLVLSTCCHHRCLLSGLKGREYLQCDDNEWKFVLKSVGWATGSVGDQQRVGLILRRLIDVARVRWLRSRGLTCKLVRYVSRGVTTENVCIVG
ncbi:MAG: uncharacterized protein KVP18_002099 [Porospora cf. gigantea A]|uniref:uncharacterized protein n=2 Tax=Porospora cf. gigantea A TaxID=2853593 RepID=UPI00355A01AE|nr:MAG: hypothetical protein KVP18_002099 [Porospora cf. gigantea A]